MPDAITEPRTLWVLDAAVGTDAAEACRAVLAAATERVAHFARRAVERGKRPSQLVIAVLDVDDVLGSALAEALMPGHDWQPIRDRGELPVCQGLVGRDGFQGLVDAYDPKLGRAVREVPAGYLPVVIVAGGTIGVSHEPLPLGPG